MIFIKINQITIIMLQINVINKDMVIWRLIKKRGASYNLIIRIVIINKLILLIKTFIVFINANLMTNNTIKNKKNIRNDNR